MQFTRLPPVLTSLPHACSWRVAKWACGLALSALACLPASAACHKVVAWKEKTPYLQLGPDQQVHGIHADLIREALARMNCTVAFVEMPWARSMLELEAGRIHMVPGAGSTPERAKFAWFSRPTNSAANVLFIRRQAAATYRLKRLADIMGTRFRLGVTVNALYGGDYDELVHVPAFQARLSPFSDRDAGWKMMLLNRTDGLIADELTGLVELEKFHYTDSIQKSDLVVFEDYDRIAIGKASNTEAFVAQLNQTLDDMIADGSFKRIFLKYHACKLSVTKLGCDKPK
jgi:polar amino acid transport system substrate-binding protein